MADKTVNDRRPTPPVPATARAAAVCLVAISLCYLAAAAAIAFVPHRGLWGAEQDGYPLFLRCAFSDDPAMDETWPSKRGAGLLLATALVEPFAPDPVAAGRIVSLVAGAALVFFGGLTGWALTSRRDAAIATAALLALSEPVLYYATLASTDMLAAGLGTAGLALLLFTDKPPSAARTLLTGMLFGAAFVTRFQMAVFLAGGLIVSITLENGVRHRARSALFYLAGAAAALAALVTFCTVSGECSVLSATGLGLLRDSALEEVAGAGGGVIERMRHLYVSHGLVQFVFAAGVLLVPAALGGFFNRVRNDGRVRAIAALAGLYLIGVVWHHAHAEFDWRPCDSRRYFLPLLPVIAAAASCGLCKIRSRAFRVVSTTAVAACLAAWSAVMLIPKVTASPADTELFAAELVERVGVDDPVVVGYPLELTAFVPRYRRVFGGFHPRPDDVRPAARAMAAVPYDALVLPLGFVNHVRGTEGPDNWIDALHEPLFCARTLCAFSPAGGGWTPFLNGERAGERGMRPAR